MALFGERPNSRESRQNPRSITRHFWLRGISDDALARAYVAAATPLIFDGLFRQDYTLDPEGAGYYDVTVPYGPIAQPEAGNYRLNFDTGGATGKITQAKEHVASYAPDGKTATDHKGAIGVTENGPEGTEIVIPQFSWTETWQMDSTYCTHDYAQILKAMTGRRNESVFRNFAAGQVRFDGATGGISSKDPEIAELTFRFTQSDDVTGLTIGTITGIAKKGWDYLWVEYEKTEDGGSNRIAHIPAEVHVERVLDPADFAFLAIGE